jgi:hypothetical protein
MSLMSFAKPFEIRFGDRATVKGVIFRLNDVRSTNKCLISSVAHTAIFSELFNN